MTSKNYRVPLLHYIKHWASFQSYRLIKNWSCSPETLNSGQNQRFFCLVWTWNLMDDLEKNRVPLPCYIKLCSSFQSHQWIQTGVTVQKRLIWVKIGDFLSCVTLNFGEWPWKTKGHPFYVASSFVHRFKATEELKLELQSGNAQFGSKSAIFCPVWPWNLTDDLEKQ